MPESSDKPLLTFAVAAFNQERFIREAVEAAFAQTYSPLEIILSDDCSEDRTFEIMRELAAAYRGPHQVLLNRNPARKSIGGHVNKIVEMSCGELIVGAAGDDVSMPERTRLTYEAWEQSGRRATSIHSGFIQIDENGRVIEQIFKSECRGEAGSAVEQAVEPLAYVQTLEPCVFGCTHAWSRRIFTIFGGLPAHVIHEDNVLAFRSILGGGLVHINEPLVKYRLHGGNVFIKSGRRGLDLKSMELQEDRVRRDFRNRETMYEAFLLDLEKAKLQALIEAADFERVFKEADRRRRRLSLMGEFLESGLFRKCRILSTLRREGLDTTETKNPCATTGSATASAAIQTCPQLRRPSVEPFLLTALPERAPARESGSSVLSGAGKSFIPATGDSAERILAAFEGGTSEYASIVSKP